MYGFIYKGNMYTIYNTGHDITEIPMYHIEYSINKAKELLSNYKKEEIINHLNNLKNDNIENIEHIKQNITNNIENTKNDMIKLFSTYPDDKYANYSQFNDVFLGKHHQNYFKNNGFNILNNEEFTPENITNKENIISLFHKYDTFLQADPVCSLSIINIDNDTFNFYICNNHPICENKYYECLSSTMTSKTVDDSIKDVPFITTIHFNDM